MQSHGDTTLDARCAATIRAARPLFERYAGLSTAQRRAIQQRIRERVRETFGANDPSGSEACSVDVVLEEATFDARDDRDYVPRP